MNSFVWSMLELAAHTAKRVENDIRCYCLGAVGIRNDQTIVRARNGFSRAKIPHAHAEARLCQKLTPQSTVFIARIRKSGAYGLAAPCASCQIALRLRQVKKVYFTTDDQEVYGVWEPR